MPKKLPLIKPPKVVSIIRSKEKRVKDPVRFPQVIDPMEKKFTDDYLKMMKIMSKMLQIELIKQVR